MKLKYLLLFKQLNFLNTLKMIQWFYSTIEGEIIEEMKFMDTGTPEQNEL